VFVPLLALLLLWHVAASGGWVSPRVLPPLDLVVATVWQELTVGRLPEHLGVSLFRILTGFAIGGIAGWLFGLAVARSRPVALFLEPVVIAGYPVPKLAFFPVVVFIFGFGTPSKIAFAAVEAFYPVALATIFAVRAIPTGVLWAARNTGASPMRLLFQVVLPASLPGLMGGLRIALPISVTVITVTEMMGDRVGLGHYIAVSAAGFRYDRVYAGLLAVGLVGFLLDRGFVALRAALLPWMATSRRR
jgi:NitT/TauT family transport system permease protein